LGFLFSCSGCLSVCDSVCCILYAQCWNEAFKYVAMHCILIAHTYKNHGLVGGFFHSFSRTSSTLNLLPDSTKSIYLKANLSDRTNGDGPQQKAQGVRRNSIALSFGGPTEFIHERSTSSRKTISKLETVVPTITQPELTARVRHPL
jgi:hypothetical protein